VTLLGAPATPAGEPALGGTARRLLPVGVAVLWRALFAAVLAAVLVVGSTAVRIWQVARQDARPASDTIVVLGSAQYDGRPAAVLEARLEHALRLYRDGVAPRIVTVGGRRAGDRFTEAWSGRRWLLDHGVPADRVVAVERGADTLESMRALGAEFRQHGWLTAVLVTDPWHVLRSERMARDSGIAAVGSPARSGPVVRTRQAELRYLARETGALLYYRLFHASPGSPPAAAGRSGRAGQATRAAAIRRTASVTRAAEVPKLRRTYPAPGWPKSRPDDSATRPRARNTAAGSAPRPRSVQSSQAT
jgi:uncharacterized SAM-binding protein YcdF (DUF218 family)